MVRAVAERAARLFAPVMVLTFLLGLHSSCDTESTSASPALDYLARMVSAEESLSYQGMKRMVFGSGEHRKTHFWLVTHYPGGPTTMEAAGQAGGRVRKWTSRRSRLYWLDDRDLLLENYRVVDLGRQEMVGRIGRVLEIRSLHPRRPSVRAVVDEKTGLLLHVLFRDYLGEPGLESSFTTLLLDPELPEPPPVKERNWPGWESGDFADLEFRPFEPRFLPDGFKAKSAKLTGWKTKKLVQVYSDGLTWITITQHPTRKNEEERVVHQHRRGSWVNMWMILDGIEISLKGKLDPDELVEVLKSLGGSGS